MRFLSSNRVEIALAGLVGLLASGFFLWRGGMAIFWPDVLVSVSLFGFVFAWSLWLARRSASRRALGFWLLVGAVLAHVIAWLPFLWRSYVFGHGFDGLDFALASGVVTAGLVGWYVMAEHLWQTALLTLTAFALLIAARPGTHMQ